MNLYQLHAINPTTWILCTVTYEMLLCLIPVAISLISILVFNSYMIFDDITIAVKNITWFMMESFYSIPTGILLAVLFKRGKPAAMTCFFLILLALVMEMF